MKIIGIAGQMFNGKDSIADKLALLLNASTSDLWQRISFAKPIKAIFCETFDVDMDFIEKWKVINEPPPNFNMTMREMLIQIGDGFRQMKGTVWIDKAIKTMEHPSICSDVRYLNEGSTIHKHDGVVILVWRAGRENDIPNRSESEMRPLVDFFSKSGIDGVIPWHQFDQRQLSSMPSGAPFVDIFIRNEGGIESLHRKVEETVHPFVVKKYDLQ